jgi:ABC-2 type transport system permease protein
MAAARSWKKYYSFGTVRVATLKEYALDFFGGLVLLPVEVAIVVLVWRVIYDYVGPLGSFDLDTMIAYQLLVHNLMRGTWSVATINYRVWQDIRQGKLDVYLARPLDYQLSKLSGELGEVAVRAFLRLAMFLLACLVLRLPLLADPFLWVLFLLSFLGGFVIKFLEQFLIATAAFWTEAIFGLRDVVIAVSQVFAGTLIPVSVMPAFFRAIAAVLPFQFILFVPAAIYLGQYSHLEALGMLGLQAAWLVALFACSRLLWRRGLARYEAQGG